MTREILPWDSEFFGMKIGRVLHPAAADVLAAAAWARAEGIRCLYALVDAGGTSARRALEDEGFRETDLRLTLDRDAAAAPEPPGHNIRPARAGDLPALEALARISHRNTRFYEDGRFDRARCDDLYAVWVRKAFDSPDTSVLVPDADGRAAGYLTLEQGRPEARIGLVAVAPDQQGRGLGDALLVEAVRLARAAGSERIRVVTQGRNARAVRFYERGGFRARSREFWYHRWFD
mgnify:CR=1 FL=1